MDTHKVLYFRKLGEGSLGMRLVLQTEHAKAYSRDRNSTATKDGIKSSGAPLGDEVSISALQSQDDPTFTLIEDSIVDDFPMEMWEVDLSDKTEETSTDGTTTTITFGAEYRQGYITSWEPTNPAEGDQTVEGTFLTEGKRRKGRVTLPDGDIETLSYVFHDLVAEDPADDGLAEETAPVA